MKNIKNSIKRKLNKEIKKMFTENKMIGSGRNRVVYDLDNGYVLKVARCKTGVRHNKREIEIYKSSTSPIRKHLAKIKDYGKLWLIMKKHDREFPQSKKCNKKLKKLKSQFIKKDIDPKDMFYNNNESKGKNLRLDHKGKIIVIDYGAFLIK
jgi:hypothetical protein